MTATDTLEAHTNILPIAQCIQNLCHQATICLAATPPAHPINPLICRAAKHFIKHHHLSLHLLTHVMIYPVLFFSWTYHFSSCDYSSFPHHWSADYTCLHNCFLPSASLDFHDSSSLTCMYFFAIPSHSTAFHLFHPCSGTFRVSDI